LAEWLCGDSRAWFYEWSQPGAYEAFTAPGNETDYRIRYVDTEVVSYKLAERRTPEGWSLALNVQRGDHSRFRVDAHNADSTPTQEQMRSLVDQALLDLNLGDPNYSNPTFSKEPPAC
jgi:hypothetical protein